MNASERIVLRLCRPRHQHTEISRTGFCIVLRTPKLKMKLVSSAEFRKSLVYVDDRLVEVEKANA